MQKAIGDASADVITPIRNGLQPFVQSNHQLIVSLQSRRQLALPRRQLALDRDLPPVLSYAVQDKNQSMYNTPPTYGIYIAGLMFDWVKAEGGVAEMERRNRKKASLLYDYIDASGLYTNPVEPASRSIMNVVFTLRRPELTDAFLSACKSAGIVNVKGHRLVGGCRASIYNGMPYAGVEHLVDVMRAFEKENQ